MTFASVCTGIGGFDFALEQEGISPLWMCERDKSCRDVLRKHWPVIPCYDDILDPQLNTAPRPNILCGGTPCQGFSVAGLRGSLEDERSNLCLRFVHLCDSLDPDVVLWENVPGVLSMSDNAFGCFLAGLVGADAPLVPPEDIPLWNHGKKGRYFGWPSAGVVAGPKRFLAWRVLDSQFFGVAQRRERVFVVADRGTGRAAQILFERKSRIGDYSTGGQTRETVAPTLSPSLSASGRGTARTGESRGQDCLITSEVAHDGVCHQAKGGDPTMDNYVACTLRSGSSNEASHNKPSGLDENLIVGYRTSGNCGVMDQGNKTAALNTATDPNQNIISFQSRIARNGRGLPSDKTPCLNSESTGDSKPLIAHQGVRRLTPRECERLQAFPDDWTLHAVNTAGREYQQADSPRYKQLGNAVTTSVIRWMARRIKIVNAVTPQISGQTEGKG